MTHTHRVEERKKILFFSNKFLKFIDTLMRRDCKNKYLAGIGKKRDCCHRNDSHTWCRWLRRIVPSGSGSAGIPSFVPVGGESLFESRSTSQISSGNLIVNIKQKYKILKWILNRNNSNSINSTKKIKKQEKKKVVYKPEILFIHEKRCGYSDNKRCWSE